MCYYKNMNKKQADKLYRKSRKKMRAYKKRGGLRGIAIRRKLI